jgi:hypothetical protein
LGAFLFLSLPPPATQRRRFTASSSHRSPYAGFLFLSAAQADIRLKFIAELRASAANTVRRTE